MRSRMLSLAVAAALLCTITAGEARADLSGENAERDGGIKGAVGLGLLGADLTLMLEGAFRVRNPWLLTLIPIAVAGGGAAGGYYMGRASVEASVATLALGMALIIPAAILVAHGRAYRASDDADDEGFIDTTEEGQPLEEFEGVGEASEEGPATETEVIGPEEETEPPPSEPAPEPTSDGSGPSARIAPPLPVGGMLRLVAEVSTSSRSFSLRSTFF